MMLISVMLLLLSSSLCTAVVAVEPSADVDDEEQWCICVSDGKNLEPERLINCRDNILKPSNNVHQIFLFGLKYILMCSAGDDVVI